MIPTESRDIAFAVLEPATAGGAGPADATPSHGGTEQNHFFCPPTRWRKCANPTWDNLWIDLGGEG